MYWRTEMEVRRSPFESVITASPYLPPTTVGENQPTRLPASFQLPSQFNRPKPTIRYAMVSTPSWMV
ncbi:hypothetical protein [Paenibacillus rhizoplanae]|uniref:hypothetical protein n=1 Tax=Paenibacillus rhizoplanae TaxID=1917181 RepID=UPI0036118838